MNKVAWFINDYFFRHVHIINRILHIISIPEVLFGIFQIFCGEWKWGIVNFFLGYLWQWIGHTYFDKNEVGEIILIKKIIEKIKRRP